VPLGEAYLRPLPHTGRGVGLLTRGEVERTTGIEPAFSAWEAGETTSQVVFQAQIWPFEGLLLWLFRRVGACGGPGHLIKMASADVADDMRTQRLPLGA